MIREYFQVPNDALEQPKLNILTWLKVLNSSTKFREFKNFSHGSEISTGLVEYSPKSDGIFLAF